jgi:hypothetical protein
MAQEHCLEPAITHMLAFGKCAVQSICHLSKPAGHSIAIHNVFPLGGHLLTQPSQLLVLAGTVGFEMIQVIHGHTLLRGEWIGKNHCGHKRQGNCKFFHKQ